MIVPFSVNDFLDRALAVYGDRLGIADEPDQPAPTLGDLSYRARRRAGACDGGHATTGSVSRSATASPSSRTTVPGCSRPSGACPASAGCSCR